ncbi:MAG: lipid ABC transporter permease/ATP-binding protein, partial [Legionellales bacterium]
MNNKTSIKTSYLYKRLLAHVKPFWLVLVLGLVANMLYSGIDASLTYMMRPFLDKAFISMDLEFVKKIPLIVLIGITLRGLVSSLGSYSMTWVA